MSSRRSRYGFAGFWFLSLLAAWFLLRVALLVAFKPRGLPAADVLLALLSGFHRDLFAALGETLSAALDRFSAVDTVGFQEGTTLTGEETDADGFVADEAEFNIFNTDRRLAAIEQLSDALAPIQQKKSIVYFNSGVTERGEDNRAQLRAAIDRAVKANVSIYPVDTRGLTAIVPGGSASQSSGRGGT